MQRTTVGLLGAGTAAVLAFLYLAPDDHKFWNRRGVESAPASTAPSPAATAQTLASNEARSFGGPSPFGVGGPDLGSYVDRLVSLGTPEAAWEAAEVINRCLIYQAFGGPTMFSEQNACDGIRHRVALHRGRKLLTAGLQVRKRRRRR